MNKAGSLVRDMGVDCRFDLACSFRQVGNDQVVANHDWSGSNKFIVYRMLQKPGCVISYHNLFDFWSIDTTDAILSIAVPIMMLNFIRRKGKRVIVVEMIMTFVISATMWGIEFTLIETEKTG